MPTLNVLSPKDFPLTLWDSLNVGGLSDSVKNVSFTKYPNRFSGLMWIPNLNIQVNQANDPNLFDVSWHGMKFPRRWHKLCADYLVSSDHVQTFLDRARFFTKKMRRGGADVAMMDLGKPGKTKRCLVYATHQANPSRVTLFSRITDLYHVGFLDLALGLWLCRELEAPFLTWKMASASFNAYEASHWYRAWGRKMKASKFNKQSTFGKKVSIANSNVHQLIPNLTWHRQQLSVLDRERPDLYYPVDPWSNLLPRPKSSQEDENR